MWILGALVLTLAFADESNKKTTVTFNEPVEVPGKVLAPGTYIFKLLDSASNRNIVQIFAKDEKYLHATILAIPDYRPTAADRPLIRFDERPSNSPEALKAWFYPGDTYGQQFVYPHDRAVAIAKRTNQNVLSMRNDMANNITTPANSAADASVQALEKADVTAVRPSGEEVDMDQAVSTKPNNPNR